MKEKELLSPVDPEFNFKEATEAEKRQYQKEIVSKFIQEKNQYIQDANEYATKKLEELMDIVNELGFVKLQEPVNIRCDISGSLLYKGVETELSQVLNELVSETEQL